MKIEASNIQEYLEKVPSHQILAFKKLREIIKENLPLGFKEQFSYGMIGFVVPHSLYPNGYHCNPKLPLPFLNIGCQKNFIGFYHLGLYAKLDLLDWWVKKYPDYSKTKLDMGKSCVRFKKLEDIPYMLIKKLVSKITVQHWIHICEQSKK